MTLTAGALGCAPPRDPDASSSSPAATSVSDGELESTSGATSGATWAGIVCIPGEQRCGGEGIETCEPTGLGWVMSQDCGPNRDCQCSDGSCETVTCVGPCESDDLLPSSAGCSFIANRQLHLVDALVEIKKLGEERREPDGLVVANPNTNLIATVELLRVPEGENHEELAEAPVLLGPGEYHVFELTSAFVAGDTTRFRSGGMYRVQSDVPIVAYQHAPYRGYVGNDSLMLLPDKTLGQHYVVASYSPYYRQSEGIGRPSYFEIIAVENNTKVEWLAQFAATAGDGLPINSVAEGEWSPAVTMNRFDTLRVAASYAANEEDPYKQDVSGTVIRSTKPIWVVGASRCSRVPVRMEPEFGYCDPLQEQLIPLEQWGSRFVVPHPPLRDGDQHHYRIYGADAGITVTFSPPEIAPPHTFSSRGEFVEIEVPHGVSFTLDATGPIMPVGYLASRRYVGEPVETTATYGDPSMYQFVPVDQFLNRYVFATGLEWDEHYVQVIRKTGQAEILLDGTAVSGFTPVGDYEFSNVQISEGAHTIESTDDFGIIQFGWIFSVHESCAGINEESLCQSSYAYPGGMKTEEIYIP